MLAAGRRPGNLIVGHVACYRPTAAGALRTWVGQRGDHVLGISVYAAQGVGGERPLEFQAEVDQAGVGDRDPAGVPRQAVAVHGPERAEVVTFWSRGLVYRS
jgi:hypothetical protein